MSGEATEQTLTEQLIELRDRRELYPAKYMLAWWQKDAAEKQQQLAGMQITINNAVASNRDCWAELKNQRQVNTELAAEIKECQAVIGELTARVDRQGEFLTKLKEKG